MGRGLSDYIRQQVSNGYSEASIKKSLLASGYNDSQIEQGFSDAGIRKSFIGSIREKLHGLFSRKNYDNALPGQDKALEDYIKGLFLKGYSSYAISNSLISRGYNHAEVNRIINEVLSEKRGTNAFHANKAFIAIVAMIISIMVLVFAGLSLSGEDDRDNDMGNDRANDGMDSGSASSIPTGKETCFDSIMNQDETGVDCGGVCKICRDDYSASSGGDKEPVGAENSSPDSDSKKPADSVIAVETGDDKTHDDKMQDGNVLQDNVEEEVQMLSDAKKLMSAKPDEAMAICRMIRKSSSLRDECHYALAIETKNDVYCTNIAEGTLAARCNSDIKASSSGSIGISESSGEKTGQEMLDVAKSIMSAEPEKAAKMCRNIKDDPRIKDDCYHAIAQETKDHSYCRELASDSKRDLCYMWFIHTIGDYSVDCKEFSNIYLRKSCESIKNIDMLMKNSPENSTGQAAA